MKFGPVPVTEAEGAILAHSVSVAGKRMRKGAWLSSDDVAGFQAEGITEVIVARLDAGDCHEDEAAARIAAAVVPEPILAHLDVSQAFTGRVNITATGPGVVRLNRAALDALNNIDPMITLATVPAWQQVAKGNMVGTVKVISYAVRDADVARACEVAKAVLQVVPPIYETADLIITEIPGGPGRKGADAIRGRVEALGMSLKTEVLVPHKTEPLTEAIKVSTADMVLILTGSATSDPYDVAPSAVRHAGGTVERFGMPVDPGNLLFLGAQGNRPVIGLPGCARSPALNGADWVLSRVACGIPVTGADIAAMGVGGLLKEIPTRPMPRKGRKSD